MSINELLVAFSNYSALLVFFSFIILVMLRKKQGAIFSGVTALFYCIGILYYPLLVEWDSGNIYRYFVWISHEVLWMGCIAYLSLNDRITWKQSVIGQLFSLPLIIVNVFRAMDTQFIKNDVAVDVFRMVYLSFETGIVLLCWLPIFVYLKNKLFTKPQPA